MANVISPYSSPQIVAWLRGLLTIAWADGDFDDEEQKLIAALTQDDPDLHTDLCSLEPISPQELADTLGDNPVAKENFLRTAVMVALADGIYSFSEDKLLRQFFQALGQEPSALEALRHTVYVGEETAPAARIELGHDSGKQHLHLLQTMQHWLDGLEIHDPRLARFLCKMIPPQCPFERDITLFGKKIIHIPPMCKINPLYDQMVGLRFRSLSYLADDCGEDISPYC